VEKCSRVATLKMSVMDSLYVLNEQLSSKLSVRDTNHLKSLLLFPITLRFTYPCGACRQFIAEFGEVEVIVANNDKEYESTMISLILPSTFQKSDLESGKRTET